jgi:SAM-dependent methyltransferase
MCGYGRHVLPLANKGYQITAIDNAPEYIQEIQGASTGLNIQVQLASLMEMQLADTFDAAICMGNSFCFFSKEEALIILKNLFKHLKPGGSLIINTWMIGEIAIRHFKEKDWFYLDNYKYLIDCNYLFNPTRVEADHIIMRNDGVTEVLKSVDYIFTVSEMEELLQEAGFILKDVYATPRLRKFKLGDSKAYLVCARKA